MSAPYYADDAVTLWHGDCREVTAWLEADVLVTDPPYGRNWTSGSGMTNAEGREWAAAHRCSRPPRWWLARADCQSATGIRDAKPVDLLSDLLLSAVVKRNVTVADPFVGSGSTLVAAAHLGMRAIGVELDERYCEIAARRLSQDVLDFGASA